MRTAIYSVQILPEGSEHTFVLVRVICDPGAVLAKIPFGYGATYDDVIKHVPDGLAWRDRDPRDPPSVVETWEPEAEEGQHVSSQP
jgi:hypothetical protein